jgi:hypothetical protein
MIAVGFIWLALSFLSLPIALIGIGAILESENEPKPKSYKTAANGVFLLSFSLLISQVAGACLARLFQ